LPILLPNATHKPRTEKSSNSGSGTIDDDDGIQSDLTTTDTESDGECDSSDPGTSPVINPSVSTSKPPKMTNGSISDFFPKISVEDYKDQSRRRWEDIERDSEKRRREAVVSKKLDLEKRRLRERVKKQNQRERKKTLEIEAKIRTPDGTKIKFKKVSYQYYFSSLAVVNPRSY
jgi:hypothetical protein